MHDAPWEHHHVIGDQMAGHDDSVVWTTVGFDVGSSTCQLVFARVRLTREDAHYVVAEREVLHQSQILLTPYATPELINGSRLSQFVDGEYAAARLIRDDIDTGAVILTGLALSTENARAVAEALADTSGRFVAISAGDVLEARLSANGAGLGLVSRQIAGSIVHIDIGGGTTKFTAWQAGHLLGVAAIDVGARLVTVDEQGRVLRIEAAAERVLERAGIPLCAGDPLDRVAESVLAETLAAEVLRHAGIERGGSTLRSILRTQPLWPAVVPDIAAVILTGGVSEYVYEREGKCFGDLGLALGRAIRAGIDRSGVELIASSTGIRATVLGVSQYSAQLSGNTVTVSDARLLPLRNLPVLLLDLDLESEDLDAVAIQRLIRAQIDNSGLADGAVALAVAWQGSATYGRLKALSTAIAGALDPCLVIGHPLVVVVDRDIAGLLGTWLIRESAGSRGVVCIDSIELHAFDHIDIGLFVPRTKALPVVVKSLMFAHADAPVGTRRR